MTTTEVVEPAQLPTDPASKSTPVLMLLRPFVGLVVPVGAVIVAFAFGAVMLVALGANPISGYAALIDGAFGGWDELADTSIKAMPLLLVGVGICIAFRAGVINIGGEGQIIAGAIASTVVALSLPDLPRLVLEPPVLLGGATGGGIWGAIPGALKAYAGVKEILSTIQMNMVAAQFLSFLLQDWLIDKAEGAVKIQQTKRLSANADLPLLPGGTRLHLGVAAPQLRLPGRGVEYGLNPGVVQHRFGSVDVRLHVANRVFVVQRLVDHCVAQPLLGVLALGRRSRCAC